MDSRCSLQRCGRLSGSPAFTNSVQARRQSMVREHRIAAPDLAFDELPVGFLKLTQTFEL